MRLTLALTGLLLAAPAAAQQVATPTSAPAADAPAPARADDEAALRGNDEAFVKAFNAGDAAALAATFTDDAEMIDEDGNVVEGRDDITDYFNAAFADSPGVKIRVNTDSVKFLGPDTAIARGRAEVVPAGNGLHELSRYTVVFVKRDGRWLQASVRDEYDVVLPHSERLKDLEWMLGEWVSESAEAVVHTNCDWADNKNFLLRTFTVQMEGKPAMTGQQRIGWDPLTRQFKSWQFDSEGGFGEGEFSHDGDVWLIKARGVRSDGRPASVTHVITRVNKDMMRWRSVHRTVVGNAAPDVDEFVLVRKPPKPR
jgi:uncharacterized protein (TIGR02246 family)